MKNNKKETKFATSKLSRTVLLEIFSKKRFRSFVQYALHWSGTTVKIAW